VILTNIALSNNTLEASMIKSGHNALNLEFLIFIQ